MRAFVGMQQVSVSYAGTQGEFAGLDQVNLFPLRSLTGAGEVEVDLSVDGAAPNRVKVRIK